MQGVSKGLKNVLYALQFGFRLAIIFWFWRLA
jgi:hypothetical protein